jgi:Holliday junction DNA helicase RuvB
MAKARIVTPLIQDEDREYDKGLRPKQLKHYIGQTRVKENISIFINAAKGRAETLDHILLHGPPGLGKTTLAHIIANELEVNIKSTSGPALEKPGYLASILTNLGEGDVLFIDEIHRLPSVVEEVLYPAMEDFKLDIVIGKGPGAKAVKIELPRFTLVGATTRAGLLTAPLRNRFGVTSRLDFYPPEDLKEIIIRSAEILKINLTLEGASELARRARGTPRVANRLLRRVRDYAEVKANGAITREVATQALEMFGVDDSGLDEMDQRILLTIIEKFQGGPVGLETLSVAVGEEKDSIEDVYEPYLIRIGFLARTRQGRVVTELGYKHFKLTKPGQTELW